MKRYRQAAVPRNRAARIFRLGRLASGVAVSAIGQGAKRWIGGQRPAASELLLSSGNAERIARQLAEMRGAAMKVGQLLSMEAGEWLPPEMTEMLSILRDDAYRMPDRDLERVLQQAWGARWRQRFAYFDAEPFAAASIGQVHEARHLDGRRLAVKVQYPGIVDSIDSDIANLRRLLQVFGLVPPGLDLDALLDIARSQLHEEADYRLEARNLRLYRERLRGEKSFRLPEVIDELSDGSVLAMTYLEGERIESLTALEPVRRERVLNALIDLTLKEFLHWGLVQSDPNFANFLFDPEGDTIGLLDFGALRINDPARAAGFAALLEAALERNPGGIIDAAAEIGYLRAGDDFSDKLALADLIQTAAEPALHPGSYDFAASTLARRLADKLLHLRRREAFQRLPPADVMFLHRKLAGIYLLCRRVNARLDVRSRVVAMLDRSTAAPGLPAA